MNNNMKSNIHRSFLWGQYFSSSYSTQQPESFNFGSRNLPWFLRRESMKWLLDKVFTTTTSYGKYDYCED